MAAYHNKEIFVVIPTDELKRNDKYKKEQEKVDCQSAHLKFLKALGNILK